MVSLSGVDDGSLEQAVQGALLFLREAGEGGVLTEEGEEPFP
jgi:hypothetical protein